MNRLYAKSSVLAHGSASTHGSARRERSEESSFWVQTVQMCHSERSEESALRQKTVAVTEIVRFAQNDTTRGRREAQALQLLRIACVVTYAVLIIAIAGGCRQGEIIEPPDMKAPVRVGDVTRDTIEAIVKTTGTLKAKEQAVVLAESEGRFVLGKNRAGARLDEGDEVDSGQVIAELKNPELVATIAVDARKSELEQAEKELERIRKLLEGGITAEADLEPAETAMTRAQYAYSAALAQLEKLEMKSPVFGKIVKLAEIVDGARVVPGTEIATIMNYRTIIADVNIANSDFPRVIEGQDVRVSNFALEGDAFEGTVSMIRPVADEQTRAFKAEITIANPDEQLRPGMFVRADIVVARHEDAIIVPPELVLTRNNRSVVFVVESGKSAGDPADVSPEDDNAPTAAGNSSDRAVAREVELGIETKDAVEIVSGIEPDDRIIVEGYETLRDDTPVRVSK